jgi:hypothetical protein
VALALAFIGTLFGSRRGIYAQEAAPATSGAATASTGR